MGRRRASDVRPKRGKERIKREGWNKDRGRYGCVQGRRKQRHGSRKTMDEKTGRDERVKKEYPLEKNEGNGSVTMNNSDEKRKERNEG